MQEAGIALIQSNAYYLRPALTRGPGDELLARVYLCRELEEKLMAEKPLMDAGDEVRLSLEVRGLTAGIKADCGRGETDVMQDLDVRSLSTETAGGFVGCTVGMCAVSGRQTEESAVYKEFLYQEIRSL